MVPLGRTDLRLQISRSESGTGVRKMLQKGNWGMEWKNETRISASVKFVLESG